jgi:hypothetical protein
VFTDHLDAAVLGGEFREGAVEVPAGIEDGHGRRCRGGGLVLFQARIEHT